MIYRPLGNTGKQASIIGLGCEHMVGQSYEQVHETVNRALDSGVNIFDVFMPGIEVRENIARAIGSRRDQVMIQGHIGSTDINQQFDISRDMKIVQKYFEDMLRIFGGHIECGMLFFIDSEKDFSGVFDTDFVNYALRLKQNGDIGHIGFSSHNPDMAIKAIATGVPEMMMFSINPAFDMLPSTEYSLDMLDKEAKPELFHGIDPKRSELYKICEQRGVGITVMKTYCAGKLLSAEHCPFEKPLTTAQCIHYALSRPAVTSVMIGCKTEIEVDGSVQYLSASDEERDYATILGTMRNDFKGNCVYCSHCQPCPSSIDIASVNKYLDIARLDSTNVQPTLKAHYNSLPARGCDCIECGNCESRCPFGVPIIKNMKDAERMLG